MKKINLLCAIVVAMIFITMGAFIYTKTHNRSKEITVTLEAPEKCKIGQLITFDASMNQIDDITWDISPLTLNFRIIDGGRKAIFSSEKAENYTITVAISYNNKVYLVINKMEVISNSIDPVNIDIDPVDIDPVNIDIDPVNIDIDPVNIDIDIPLPIDILPDKNEKEDDPNLNIVPWLPLDYQNLNLDKIINNLNVLSNLIDKNRFETEDEMVQAVIWSIKRATQEDKIWEPFILNLSKYLENSTSKQNCAQRIKNVLIHLERINNQK